MINQAIEKLNSDTASSAGTLMIRESRAKIGAQIESVSDFDQEKAILDLASVVECSKSVIPSQIMHRMQNRIVGVLVRNGVNPYIAALKSEDAQKATLELAGLIQKFIPDAKQREDFVEGKFGLDAIPALEQALRSAEQLALESGELLQRGPTDAIDRKLLR